MKVVEIRVDCKKIIIVLMEKEKSKGRYAWIKKRSEEMERKEEEEEEEEKDLEDNGEKRRRSRMSRTRRTATWLSKKL